MTQPPLSEYDRMLDAARRALRDRRPADFQLSETALRVAEEQGLAGAEVRTHFLVAAYMEHLRSFSWDVPPELLT